MTSPASILLPQLASTLPSTFSTRVFGDWEPSVSSRLFRVQAERVGGPDCPFHGQVTVARFKDSAVADVVASAHRVLRRTSTGRSERYLKVLWQLGGATRLQHSRRTSVIGAGQWAVYDTSRPYAFEATDGSHFQMVLIPISELQRRGLSLVESCLGMPLQRTGMVEVARSALAGLLAGDVDICTQGQSVLQDSILALLGAAVSNVASAQDREERLTNRRLELVHRYIDGHFTRTTLRADEVAAACGLSRRTLYLLFRSNGMTPHTYIMQRRLDRARELLQAVNERRTLTEIAFELGFADLSHFSRAFSARYGMSPSMWRSAHVEHVSA